jgi:uncharacterized protein (TIGR03437 family)
LASEIAAAQTITTYAGNGNAGFSGDGGPAVLAEINDTVGLAVDASGNIYLADQNNNRVRKVTASTGIISTIAGTSSSGFSGDGGPATSATLNGPTGVCLAPTGDVYVNDQGNHRVRKIAVATGIITTVAGNGSTVPSGDGGLATSAGMQIPIRCAVDSGGNLYIVDQGSNAEVVRKVNSAGIISLVAGVYGGSGFSGDGGPATSATMFNLTAITIDPAGNLYLTDQSDQRIRMVNTSGIISTVAGNGIQGYSGDGGSATAAELNYPGETSVDAAGNLYIVDTVNQRIRKVSGGIITTVAGTGVLGYAGDGSLAAQAEFNYPFAITIDPSANIYVGDNGNSRVRQITGVASAGALPAITVTTSSIGVTNAASFQTGVAPGGILTIFGTHLGATAGQTLLAPGAPWPSKLGTTSVTINGLTAPVYYVLNLNGTEQLSVQAPWSVTGTTASVIVTTIAGSSTSVSVPVLAAQPGIFLLDAASDGATHAATGAIVTAASPAALGEYIVLYMTGMGVVSNEPVTGAAASSTTLSNTAVTPIVSIGGVNATEVFSGLTPGFIGLYQINVQVPSNAPAGVQNVTVQANGVTSNMAKLAVQ